jgi:hypothetical protein
LMDSIITHTYLHFDVQDASAALGGNILHGSEGGTVAAPRKRRMLNERVLLHELLEAFGSGEMVFDAIGLSGPGGTGSIFEPRTVKNCHNSHSTSG